jgi:hypothetical protein
MIREGQNTLRNHASQKFSYSPIVAALLKVSDSSRSLFSENSELIATEDRNKMSNYSQNFSLKTDQENEFKIGYFFD